MSANILWISLHSRLAGATARSSFLSQLRQVGLASTQRRFAEAPEAGDVTFARSDTTEDDDEFSRPNRNASYAGETCRESESLTVDPGSAQISTRYLP